MERRLGEVDILTQSGSLGAPLSAGRPRLGKLLFVRKDRHGKSSDLALNEKGHASGNRVITLQRKHSAQIYWPPVPSFGPVCCFTFQLIVTVLNRIYRTLP